jgi:CBS-domain-containing membrane protein
MSAPIGGGSVVDDRGWLVGIIAQADVAMLLAEPGLPAK